MKEDLSAQKEKYTARVMQGYYARILWEEN